MQKPFLQILFLLLCTGLSAQIYRGTIGKIPVFLNVEQVQQDGSIYGSYFYRSQGVDIPFEGTAKGGQLVFYAGSRFAETGDQELFKLVKKASALTGTWLYKGKKLAVQLQETDAFSLPNMYEKNPLFTAETPLEHIRTSLARFDVADSVTSLPNGISLKWYKEHHWESVLFRVAGGLPDSTMEWLNNKLEALQLQAFSYRGTCGQPWEDGDGWHTALNDYFINADFCSLEIVHDYYCGGAHPDFSSQVVNLDLRNLRELSTDELVLFPGVVKQTENNFTEWSEYRSGFGERVNEYIRSLYPEYMPPPGIPAEELEECNYDDPGIWEFSDVRITPDGFKVGAYFPRFARSCDDPEWAYIPYDVIEPFINPAYRKQLMKLSK